MALNGTLYDFEMQKFVESSDRPGFAIPQVSVVGTISVGPSPFAPPALSNYIGRSVVSNVETYVYKSGGAGGTTLKTLTVTYTDATLQNLTSVLVS